MSVPTVKTNMDSVRISRRPKISERAAMKGWKTTHARRYDVPAQKASVALPLMALEIVWVGQAMNL